jgi:IS5 family transposase
MVWNAPYEGNTALMLVTKSEDQTLWEAMLPPEYQRLPPRLARVDELLDDPVFCEPYREHFSAVLGRPSVPIQTYLRMMFLKFSYRLGYESLCREVADSICWTRFCRIPLGTRVPHPSTLQKITARCGPQVIGQLNEALLARAGQARVLRMDTVRADSTVVPANVRYPTDSGLLARAISRITGLVERIHAAGAAPRTKVRDRRRSARARAHQIAAHLRKRSGEAQGAVLAVTGELADLCQASITEAAVVVRNARRRARRQGDAVPGRLLAAICELEVLLARAGKVVAQTRTRLAGDPVESATRIVSLHDPDARPIKKGKLSAPVEFGYKGQVTDNRDGVVLDYSVHQGNPADASLLAPAIGRITGLFGRAPGAVTADRGYGEAKVDAELARLGVKKVVIPRKGKPGTARREHEHSRAFRKLVKWRTGSEGRIAQLKHRYGWDRTLMDELDGATTWCGLGVLAHNTAKISGLIAARADATGAAARAAAASAGPRRGPTATPTTRRPAVKATGPPGQPGTRTAAA